MSRAPPDRLELAFLIYPPYLFQLIGEFGAHDLFGCLQHASVPRREDDLVCWYLGAVIQE